MADGAGRMTGCGAMPDGGRVLFLESSRELAVSHALFLIGVGILYRIVAFVPGVIFSLLM